MERYDPSTDEGSCKQCGWMSKDPDGEYVLYAAAQAEIARLTADLATSRAETAMAFEVAAHACDAIAKSAKEYNIPQMAGGAIGCRNDIRKLTPADATAALAARDKATREKALRDAANECENRRQGWLKSYILFLIQEENQ